MAISIRRGLFIALTVMFVLIAGYLKAEDTKGKAGPELVSCIKEAQEASK